MPSATRPTSRPRPHRVDPTAAAQRAARRSEPKRLRYRLLHVAGRPAFHARTATLRIQASWPWATELTNAFARLAVLPAPPV